MLVCAVSITASRSCSFARFSCVAFVCSLIELPMRWVMPSSRSLMARFSSACREPKSSAMVAMRPCISDCALRIAAICSSSRWAR